MQINEVNKLPSVLEQLTANEEEIKTTFIAYSSEEKALAPLALVDETAAATSAMEWDPHYSNIEETIDELERRINQEKVRFSKLIANRHIYEQWMGPHALNGLVREASFRMLNFDPNFDAEPEPLPHPCLYNRPDYMGSQSHPYTNTAGVNYFSRTT